MFDVSSPYRQDMCFFFVFWVSFDVRNLPKTNFKHRFKGHQHTSNIDTLQNELQGYQTSIQPMLYYSELILALCLAHVGSRSCGNVGPVSDLYLAA